MKQKLEFMKVSMKLDIDEYSTSLKSKVTYGDVIDDDDDVNDNFQPVIKRTKLMDSK